MKTLSHHLTLFLLGFALSTPAFAQSPLAPLEQAAQATNEDNVAEIWNESSLSAGRTCEIGRTRANLVRTGEVSRTYHKRYSGLRLQFALLNGRAHHA